MRCQIAIGCQQEDGVINNYFSRETRTPLFDLINTELSIRHFVDGHYTEMTNNHMRARTAAPNTFAVLFPDLMPA